MAQAAHANLVGRELGPSGGSASRLMMSMCIPFADRVDVVVDTPARFAALEQTALHLRLGALKVEHKGALAHLQSVRQCRSESQLQRRGRCGRTQTHRLLKLEGLVHLAREAVDQEAVAFAGLHGVLEQVDRDLHGNDLALPNAARPDPVHHSDEPVVPSRRARTADGRDPPP